MFWPQIFWGRAPRIFGPALFNPASFRSCGKVSRRSAEGPRRTRGERKKKHHEHFIRPPVTPYGRPNKCHLKFTCPSGSSAETPTVCTQCTVKVYGATPKFHYADFPETSPWHVVRGSFGVSNHCDMSKWFEKFPWQVGNKPVCVWETGKSAPSATRHGEREVGDVADKSTRTSRVRHGLVADVTGNSA